MLRRKPQKQAREGYAARARKKDQKNVKTSVALEAKPLGEMKLKFQQPSWR
jgi:hypothetical protein